MAEVTPALIKGLFRQLVERCGSVDAAAACLGVTHQRVSQAQSLNCPEMPTLMQVCKLEAFAQASVVLRALADLAECKPHHGDLAKETRELTYAAVDLQRSIDSGKINWAQVRALKGQLAKELEDVEALLAAAPT